MPTADQGCTPGAGSTSKVTDATLSPTKFANESDRIGSLDGTEVGAPGCDSVINKTMCLPQARGMGVKEETR